jgi:WD40 repeat protein
MRRALLTTLMALAIGGPCLAQEPKLRTTLVGHTAKVNDVAFAPYGNVLASASDDGTVRLWDMATSKSIATFVHTSPVLSVAFDDYGLRLATGCQDGTVRVWNRITGSQTYCIRGEFPARHVWFARNFWQMWFGETCVGVTYPAKNKPIDGNDFWIMNTGKKVGLVITTNSVNLDVSASSDFGWAIANEEPHFPEHPVTIGEISFTPALKNGTAQFPIALRGHTGRVCALAFSPLGKQFLFSGSLDNTIKIWNPATASCVATLKDHAGGVYCLKFSKDGKTLVSGSGDTTIKLWEMPRETVE